MAEAALKLAAHLGYRGLGTVELLVDRERDTFYFLEMNARIQVEHPVTEMITGLDLVAEQLAVAEGQPLRIRQEDVVLTGHAVECRINAEEWRAVSGRRPGRIDRVVLPVGEGMRVDTHVQGGSVVPPFYDSLLAKLIVHGTDRADALARARAALDLLRIEGVTTTVPVHQALLADPEFGAGGVDTAFFERFLRSHQTCGGALMATSDSSTSRCATATRACGAPPASAPGTCCQVAPLLERVGFRALDYSSSTAMGVAVRIHREDPWERLRLTRAAMPTTKLQFIGTGFRFISWQNSHPETMQLVYDRLAVNGIDRVVVLDPMHDMDAARETARRLKQAGIDEVIGALTYTISAVHDDAFYVDLATQYAADAELRPGLRQGPGRHPHRRARAHAAAGGQGGARRRPRWSCTRTPRSGCRR